MIKNKHIMKDARGNPGFPFILFIISSLFIIPFDTTHPLNNQMEFLEDV